MLSRWCESTVWVNYPMNCENFGHFLLSKVAKFPSLQRLVCYYMKKEGFWVYNSEPKHSSIKFGSQCPWVLVSFSLNGAVHKDGTPSRVIDMLIEPKFETFLIPLNNVLWIKQENCNILNQFHSIQETEFTLKRSCAWSWLSKFGALFKCPGYRDVQTAQCFLVQNTTVKGDLRTKLCAQCLVDGPAVQPRGQQISQQGGGKTQRFATEWSMVGLEPATSAQDAGDLAVSSLTL